MFVKLVSSWKDEVSTPALIIDYDLMKKNIETMAKFAKENKVDLRPHVKTHKCPIIGKMQLEAGSKGICVAKVGEAEVFAQGLRPKDFSRKGSGASAVGSKTEL